MTGLRFLPSVTLRSPVRFPFAETDRIQIAQELDHDYPAASVGLAIGWVRVVAHSIEQTRSLLFANTSRNRIAIARDPRTRFVHVSIDDTLRFVLAGVPEFRDLPQPQEPIPRPVAHSPPVATRPYPVGPNVNFALMAKIPFVSAPLFFARFSSTAEQLILGAGSIVRTLFFRAGALESVRETSLGQDIRPELFVAPTTVLSGDQSTVDNGVHSETRMVDLVSGNRGPDILAQLGLLNRHRHQVLAVSANGASSLHVNLDTLQYTWSRPGDQVRNAQFTHAFLGIPLGRCVSTGFNASGSSAWVVTASVSSQPGKTYYALDQIYKQDGNITRRRIWAADRVRRPEVRVSANSSHYFIADENDSSVWIVDTAQAGAPGYDPHRLVSESPANGPMRLELTPDPNRFFYATGRDLYEVNIHRGAWTQGLVPLRFPETSKITAVRTSASGRFTLVGVDNGKVYLVPRGVLSARGIRVLTVLPTPSDVHALAITPDETAFAVVVVNQDGQYEVRIRSLPPDYDLP